MSPDPLWEEAHPAPLPRPYLLHTSRLLQGLWPFIFNRFLWATIFFTSLLLRYCILLLSGRKQLDRCLSSSERWVAATRIQCMYNFIPGRLPIQLYQHCLLCGKLKNFGHQTTEICTSHEQAKKRQTLPNSILLVSLVVSYYYCVFMLKNLWQCD